MNATHRARRAVRVVPITTAAAGVLTLGLAAPAFAASSTSSTALIKASPYPAKPGATVQVAETLTQNSSKNPDGTFTLDYDPAVLTYLPGSAHGAKSCDGGGGSVTCHVDTAQRSTTIRLGMKVSAETHAASTRLHAAMRATGGPSSKDDTAAARVLVLPITSGGTSTPPQGAGWSIQPRCYDRVNGVGHETFEIVGPAGATFTLDQKNGHTPQTESVPNAGSDILAADDSAANQKATWTVTHNGKIVASTAVPPENTCTSAGTTSGAHSSGHHGDTATGTATGQHAGQVATVPKGAVNTGGGATAGVEQPWLLGIGGAAIAAGAGAAVAAGTRWRKQ
jgi:hypothetical protein